MTDPSNYHQQHWYWFLCPECENTWGSENNIPEREWCAQNCIDTPELIYEEATL